MRAGVEIDLRELGEEGRHVGAAGGGGGGGGGLDVVFDCAGESVSGVVRREGRRGGGQEGRTFVGRHGDGAGVEMCWWFGVWRRIDGG